MVFHTRGENKMRNLSNQVVTDSEVWEYVENSKGVHTYYTAKQYILAERFKEDQRKIFQVVPYGQLKGEMTLSCAGYLTGRMSVIDEVTKLTHQNNPELIRREIDRLKKKREENEAAYREQVARGDFPDFRNLTSIPKND